MGRGHVPRPVFFGDYKQSLIDISRLIILAASFVLLIGAGCSSNVQPEQGKDTQAVHEEAAPAGNQAAPASPAAQQAAPKTIAAKTHVINIGPDKIHEMEKNGAILIDVRETAELNGPLGKIEGIKNMPLSRLGQEASTLDKNATYVIVCRSGSRSRKASEFLVSNGFTNIYNLNGGMKAYRNYFN